MNVNKLKNFPCFRNAQSQYELMGIVSGGFAGVRDQIYVFVGQEKVLQWIKRNKDDINLRDDAKNMSDINVRDDAKNKDDINVRDEYGETKLYRAAYAGDLEECRRLVAAGANVNIARYDGSTPLITASYYGHLSIVKLLCDHDADVNIRDKDGGTALMYASYNGHLTTVKLLCDHDADVNIRDKDGWTALMRASGYGKTDVVEYLISRGASVNDVNNNGYSALMRAAWYGHLEIVKNLVENGADKNIKNNDGDTALALVLARRNGNTALILTQDEDVMKFLRNKDDINVRDDAKKMSDINERDEYGRTKLYRAARAGDLEECERLLDAGANVNIADIFGSTPLFSVCLQECMNCCWLEDICLHVS